MPGALGVRGVRAPAARQGGAAGRGRGRGARAQARPGRWPRAWGAGAGGGRGAPREARAGGGAGSLAEASGAGRGGTRGANSEPGAEPGVGTGTGTMEEDDSYGQYGPRPAARPADAPSRASSCPRPGGASGGSRFPGVVVSDRTPGAERGGNRGGRGGGGRPGRRAGGAGSRGLSRRPLPPRAGLPVPPERPAPPPAALSGLPAPGVRKSGCPGPCLCLKGKRRKQHTRPERTGFPRTFLRPGRGAPGAAGAGPRPLAAQRVPVDDRGPGGPGPSAADPTAPAGEPEGAATEPQVCFVACAPRQRDSTNFSARLSPAPRPWLRAARGCPPGAAGSGGLAGRWFGGASCP